MLLLFCLLIGYGVIRLWEDTTARWRNETPPRHEHRMERMRQRAAAGGKPRSSAFGRYMSGLADDIWSSAHEKRNLMADARRVKREEEAKRKSAKIIARQRAKTQASFGFDATVPDKDGDNTAPAAAPVPASDDGETSLAGTSIASAASPPPAGAAAPPAAGHGAPMPADAASEDPAPVGFFATVPQAGDETSLPRRTPHMTPPEAWALPGAHRSGFPASPGTATRALARELAPQ
ncbi:MAG TPA: hypothetical protein VGL02_20415, partial [Streptomyces sp.]